MQNDMSSFFSLDVISNFLSVEQILNTNEKSQLYGLKLNQKDALELIEIKNNSLAANGRIEVGGSTVENIIAAFYDSPYIIQGEYAYMISELIETFFYMKNETFDVIPDDELIGLMRHYFDNNCKGTLALLQSRELEKLAQNIRFGVVDYADLDSDKDKEEGDLNDINSYLDDEDVF